MTGRLAGRRAFVTGASRGIGREIARRYAAEGADVVGVARDVAAVDELGADVEGEPGSVRGVRCDVRETGAVEDAVATAVDELGGLDVLVNNAGVLSRGTVEETTDDEMTRTVDVNLQGVVRVTRACLPHLRESEGCIVNVSSVTAHLGAADLPVYSATKGGVSALTRQLAAEYGDVGVRVNAISPGTVATPINENAREDDEWVETRERITALGRLAEPEDVAGPAVFLASDDAAYVTGHDVVVDGGASL